MSDDFLSLVSEARALNSSVFSLIRLQLLANLNAVSPESVTFREFKAGLQVTDGALYANLKALIEMGYVKSKEVVLEGKKLESYWITSEGKNEWIKVKEWLKKFLESDEK
ncbi:MAG: transcriptional regulator [archaeon]